MIWAVGTARLWLRRGVGPAAGLVLIVIGVIAPIGRAISLIPAPAVGGTAVVVYSIVLGAAPGPGVGDAAGRPRA